MYVISNWRCLQWKAPCVFLKSHLRLPSGRWGVWYFKIPEIIRTCNSAWLLEVPVARETGDGVGRSTGGLDECFGKNAWTTDFLRYLFEMGASKTKKKDSEGYGPSRFACTMKGDWQCYSLRPWFALLSFVPMLFFWAMWRHHHYGPVLSLLSLFLHDYFGMEIGRCSCALFGHFFEALNFPLWWRAKFCWYYHFECWIYSNFFAGILLHIYSVNRIGRWFIMSYAEGHAFDSLDMLTPWCTRRDTSFCGILVGFWMCFSGCS